MLTVTLANFFAVLFAYIGRITKKEKIGLLFSIIFLIFFYGIRGDYGNDPPNYHEDFDKINSEIFFSEFWNTDMRYEPGWMFLNLAFGSLGWQSFIIFLTIFQFSTLYYFIKRYSESKYYWIVLFFYVFNSNLLLTNLSMLRQSMAMSIGLIGLPYFFDKKIVKSIICILLAMSIHSSGFVLLLFLLVPYISRFSGKMIFGFIFCAFIFFMAANAVIGDFVRNAIILMDYEKYEVYLDDEYKGSNLYALVQLFICGWIFLKCHPKVNMKKISIIYGYIVVSTMFTAVVPLFGRIMFYFILPSIVVYNILIEHRKQDISRVLVWLTVLMTLIGYFSFFKSPIYHDYYANYVTIFD